MRTAIAARERHINETLQETTNERHLANQFVQTIEPYRALMAAEGVSDPLQAVHGLLNTTARLSMGTPQQKAQQIAGLVQHYGIDYQQLDDALVALSGGQAPAQQPTPASDPRLDWVINQMRGAQQAQQDNLTREAHTSVENFAADTANEFYPTVKSQMADILDMKANQGVKVSLKEAYDMACGMNPEISAVLAARNVGAAADQQNGMMAGKRAASSSIAGEQSGSGGGLGDMSMREALAAQFDEQGRV